MAMEPKTTLAELNEKTEIARVVAKVIRIWLVPNHKNGEFKEMRFVLLDSEGTAMEGYMMLEVYLRISKEFVEGSIYELERFIVEKCPKEYRTVPNEFLLNFTNDTYIKLVINPPQEIPFYYFKFVNFEDIGKEIRGNTTLVDIIGRLEKIDPVMTIETKYGPVYIQAIHLVNERGFSVEVTMWEPFLHFIPLAALAEQSKEVPVVLAFNSLQLRNNNRALTTFCGTMIYFDQNFPIIEKFCTSTLQGKFDPVNIDAVQEKIMRIISSSSRIANSQPLRVTIAELLVYNAYSSTAKQFQCIAKIDAINNPSSLFYEACPYCKKKHQRNNTDLSYWCNNCRRWSNNALSCYNIALKVTDDTASTEFLIFGDNAQFIVGKPAENVRYEWNHVPHLGLPSIVRALLGKTMVFTIQFDLDVVSETYGIFKVLTSVEMPQLSVRAPMHIPRDIVKNTEHGIDNNKRKAEESIPVLRQQRRK